MFCKSTEDGDMLKALEKHLEVASQIHRSMESLQVKIEELEEWRSSEKNVLDGLPALKSYDIRLLTLATHECQELSSKFEERVKQSIVEIMKIYTSNIQEMKRNVQLLEIDLQQEQPMTFSFFQKIENEYEAIKGEVRAKDMISMEEIQKFIIKPVKEVTKFNDFIRIFKEEMEILKECHLQLDIKKECVFNAREQQINAHHESWSKHMKNKGG